MSKLLARLSLAATGVLGVVLLCLVFHSARLDKGVLPVVHAQDDPPVGSKTVEIDLPLPWYAISLINIREGDLAVTPGTVDSKVVPGTPFSAGEDWLKNLSFVLKNKTLRNIAFVWVDACFPETRDNGAIICWPMKLGRIPENVAHTPTGERLDQGDAKPLNFAPGQELKVAVADHDESGLRHFIEERRPFSSLSKCWLHLGVAYFEDGMDWFGTYHVPDPSQPHGSRIIDPYASGVLLKRTEPVPRG